MEQFRDDSADEVLAHSLFKTEHLPRAIHEELDISRVRTIVGGAPELDEIRTHQGPARIAAGSAVNSSGA